MTYFTEILERTGTMNNAANGATLAPNGAPMPRSARAMAGRSGAQIEFVKWVKANHPELYSAALEAAREESGMSPGTLAQADKKQGRNFWQSFTENATALGTAYLTLQSQRDAMQLNLERARQGLPPIDTGAVAPVIRTQVEVPPDVVDRITTEAGAGFNRLLFWGGLGLLAFMAFGRKKRR